MAGVHFKVTGDANGYIAATRQAEVATGNLTRKVESEGRSIDAIFKTIAGSAAAFFSLQQLDNYRQKLIDVRGEFQNLEIAFATILQSEEKSVSLMAQLTDTAAKTPFGLKEVSNGAKQLLAYGIAAEEVNDTIIRLGNIASGLTIPLNDLVYLYGTTMTQGRLFTQDLRQFQGRGIPIADELAKQFGVTKDKVGELVTAGKVGFPEVQKAIQSMTNEGGKFFQLMEKQSGSLAGMRSNLEDSIDMMLNEIGKDMQGALSASINLTAKLVENYKSIGQAILDIVVAFGAYKAAVATVSAVQSASSRLSYAVEIDELGKLIPLKKASANADVESAAASGMISRATAEKVIAMRAEATAYVEELKLIADKTRQELTALLVAKRTNAEEIVAIKAKIAALREQGKTRAADALSMKLQSLEMQKVTLASQVEAAQVAYNTATINANTAAQNLNSVSNTANAKTTGILTLAKMKLATASKAVGDAIKANPVMVFATAVAAAVTVVYKLATAANTSEAALEAFNSRLDDIKEASNRLKDEAEGLIRTIQDETQTSIAQMDAYKKLSALFPDLTRQYSFASLAALDLAEAQRLINLQIESTNTQKLQEDLMYWQKVANGGFFKRMGAAAKNMGFWSFITEWDYRGFAEEMAGNITKELSDQLDSQAKAEFESKTFEAKMQIRVEQQSDAEANMERARQDLLDWTIENQHLLLGMELPVGPEFDAAMAGKTESEIRAEQDRILAEWNNGSYGILPFQLLFNYQQSQEQFEEAKNYVEQLKAEQQSGAATMNYGEAYREAETAWKNAKKALEDIKKNRDKYTQEDYEKAVEKEKDTAESFKTLGGDTTKNAEDEAKKRKEAIRKADEAEAKVKNDAANKALREQEDLDNQVEQARINAMADGAEKRRAQRNLDNAMELQQIKRSKEDFVDAYVERERAIFDAEEAAKSARDKNYQKQVFDEDASRARAEGSEAAKQYSAKLVYTQRKQEAESREEEAELIRQINDELLGEFKTYEQQRSDITDKYAKAREKLYKKDALGMTLKDESGKPILKEGVTQGNLDEIARAEQEDLAAIDQQFASREAEFQAWMNKIANYTLTQLKQTLEQAEQELAALEAQSPNAPGLAEARAKVGTLRKTIKKEEAEDNVSPGKRSIEEWKDLQDALSDCVDSFDEIGEAVGGVAGEILSTAGSIAGQTLGMINGIVQLVNISTTGMTATGQTAATAIGMVEKASVILAVISAALQVVMGIINAVKGLADKDNEREIERLAEENEKLDKSYKDLERDINKAYSVDASKLIDQQNILLEQKKANLRLMIAEEKAKKNADEEQIKEWEDQINGIETSIEDNAEKAKEAVNGISFDGFRDNFLDALLDMEEGAEGLADTIEEDIRKAMYEALLTDDAFESQLKGLYDDLAAAIEAGDTREIDRLKSAILNLYDSQERKAREIDEKLGYEADSTRSASEKGVAQASQSSVEELNGRMTAVQSHTFSINERVGGILNVASQTLARVISIEGHTSRLETIENNIANMTDYLSDILTRGITVR